MEQLNNRIRSTRRMCFHERIPCNVEDESEGENLVPARFNNFSSLEFIALTHVDVERLLLAGVTRPGSEVLDILIHEKQPKRTLDKNTGQSVIRDKTDWVTDTHTGPDLVLFMCFQSVVILSVTD